MNHADPAPPIDPAPPTNPAPSPEPAKDDGQSLSGVRLALNFLALLLSGVTMAPIGVLFVTDLMDYIPKGREGTPMVIYWIGFLALAGYATFTRNKLRGQFLTLVIWSLALLNLYGCAAALIGIGKATGG